MLNKNIEIFEKDYKKGLLSKSALLNLKNDESGYEDLNINNSIKKIDKCKISIIIPTHNRLNHLKKLLNSIFAQSYTNYEIIIIDDVSVDDTNSFFTSLKEPRIRYVRNEKNLGMGLNRQKGYKMATGDFVIFCDDDDFFIDNDYFKETIRIFKNKQVSLICSSSYIFYENRNDYEPYLLNTPTKINSIAYLEKFQFELKKPTSSFPLIVRKEVLEKAKFEDMKMMNDSSIYLRSLMVGGITYTNNKIIGVYRIHDSNISHNVGGEFIIENLNEKKYVYDYLRTHPVDFDLDQWFEKEVKLTVEYYFNGNNDTDTQKKEVLNWVKRNVSHSLYKEYKEIIDKSTLNNHNHSLNILKVICATLIVFNHCIFPGKVGVLIRDISRVAVPIFFIISGYYVYRNSEYKKYKKIIRILLMLVGASLFWFIFTIIRYSVINPSEIKNYLSGFTDLRNVFNFFVFNSNIFWEHLWFLNALLYCYIFEYFNTKFKIRRQGRIELPLATILLLGYFLINIFIIDDSYSNIYFIRNFIFVGIPFFLIGKNIHRFNIAHRVGKKVWLIASIFVSILFVFERTIYKSELFISSMIGACLLFIICLKKPDIHNSKIESIGNNLNLYIYILHPAIKYVVLDVIDKSKIGNVVVMYIYPIIVLLITTVIAYIIYMIKTFILKKIRGDRKKCLVIGYMNNNLGDDLFFKILFERYPNVDFYMFPPSTQLKRYHDIFRRNHNVKFYDDNAEFQRLKRETYSDDVNIFPIICEKAKDVDFFINIGGSIFIQNDNWKNDDRFTLKEIIKDKPSFIVGCNFGPCDDEYYRYYKKWFEKFDDICFRDDVSYQKFKDLKNARYADDIVLLESKKHVIHPIGYDKTIGFSILNPEKTAKLKKYSKNYYNFIVSTIKYYILLGFKVKIFVFCTNEGDHDAANEIKTKLNDLELRKTTVVIYKNNIKRFMKKWNKCKYIVGTRFHANILAIANGQSFLPIIYSDKTYNYLKNVDNNIIMYDIEQLENMAKEKLKFNNVDCNNNSELQFAKIDEYINKK